MNRKKQGYFLLSLLVLGLCFVACYPFQQSTPCGFSCVVDDDCPNTFRCEKRKCFQSLACAAGQGKDAADGLGWESTGESTRPDEPSNREESILSDDVGELPDVPIFDPGPPEPNPDDGSVPPEGGSDEVPDQFPPDREPTDEKP